MKKEIRGDSLDKVLFVATIDQHIRHFHYPFLKWFKDKGYEVHAVSSKPQSDKTVNWHRVDLLDSQQSIKLMLY